MHCTEKSADRLFTSTTRKKYRTAVRTVQQWKVDRTRRTEVDVPQQRVDPARYTIPPYLALRPRQQACSYLVKTLLGAKSPQ